MAKALYDIKLKSSLVPASSEEDALEALSASLTMPLDIQDVDTSVVVTEEHTLKLFILAKSMMDSEKFVYNEILAAVTGACRAMGYYARAEALADCVVTWTERIAEDLTLAEMEEWLLG